jgi:hypothetical protein
VVAGHAIGRQHRQGIGQAKKRDCPPITQPAGEHGRQEIPRDFPQVLQVPEQEGPEISDGRFQIAECRYKNEHLTLKSAISSLQSEIIFGPDYVKHEVD